MTTDTSSSADNGQTAASIIAVDTASVDRLHKNAIGLPSVLYFSLAGAAVLAAVMANTPFIASSAGASAPLAFVVAGLGLLAFGTSIVYFARRLSSAGGFYTWISHGLGTWAAFQSGWLLLGGYALFTLSVLVLLGSLINTAMSTYFHVNLPGGWVPYALVVTLLTFGVALLDIKRAAGVVFVFMILEVVTLFVVNTAIDVRGGASGHDLVHTFTLAGAKVPGVAPGGGLGVCVAMVLAVWMFVGFETSAVYGEEARNPRVAIPFAILPALVILLLVYIWSEYSAVIGFGWTHAADQLGKNAYTSWYTLGTTYIGGWFAAVMTVLNITSNLACAVAFLMAGSRYFYAMGREGTLSERFGKTHPKWGSPYVAILTLLGVSIALTLIFAFVIQKSAPGGVTYSMGIADGKVYTQTDSSTTSYLWLVTAGTMGILLVYIMVNIAAIVHVWRERHTFQRWSLFLRFLLPVFSSLIFLIPLGSFVLPAIPGAVGTYFTSLGFAATPFPFNILPLVVLLWVIGGVVYYWLQSRSSPERFQFVGKISRDT